MGYMYCWNLQILNKTTLNGKVRLSSRCEFDSRSLRGVLDTTLCVNVFQWLVAHCWFSPCTPVFSIIKTYLHDITEILLKVALSNISTNKTDCHDITGIVLHVALSEITITPVLLQKTFVLPFMFCLLTFYHLLFHYFYILKFGSKV